MPPSQLVGGGTCLSLVEAAKVAKEVAMAAVVVVKAVEVAGVAKAARKAPMIQTTLQGPTLLRSGGACPNLSKPRLEKLERRTG